MKKRITLFGYGNVGREFVRLLAEKQDYINRKYDLRLVLCEVVSKQGAIYNHRGLDFDILQDCGKGSPALDNYSSRIGCAVMPEPLYASDVLIDAMPTDIASGQPGLDVSIKGIEKGLDVVYVSKGALVTNYKRITELAAQKKVKLKYSGAAAAALPTIDIGQFSLAGCTIRSIEGILNGTTNYILTRMCEDKMSFAEALRQAKEKGIAETNSDLDIKGIDSACKILLLSNTLMDTECDLKDVSIKGIEDVTLEDIEGARHRGNTLKLVARACKLEKQIRIEVAPMELPSRHLLAGINDTNKGIVFDTDSMGRVAASGGASNPRGAAAAALKDIINMYT